MAELPASLNDSDLKNIELLARSVERAYHRPGLLMWRGFLHGLAAAVGAVVGTALLGVFSVYIFQVLGGVNLLKPIINELRATTHMGETVAPR